MPRMFKKYPNNDQIKKSSCLEQLTMEEWAIDIRHWEIEKKMF